MLSALRAPFMALRASGVALPFRLYQHLPYRGVFEMRLPRAASFRLRAHGHVIENCLFWGGLDGYEPETFLLWTHLSRGARVVLDIGANTGVFSLLAAAHAPGAYVHAFEPVPRIADLLRGNVALNSALRISVHQVAIGESSGTADLFDPGGDNCYSASLSSSFLPGRKTVQSVRVATVDEFVNDAEVRDIDLMKIDVEGYEAEALAGAMGTISKYRPAIIIEILPSASERLLGTLEELRAASYDLFWIGPSLSLARWDRTTSSTDGARYGRNVLMNPSERPLPQGHRIDH